ncbi:MAG: hypothetical protein HC835_04300 [Oscillatoriales cyanobacterium RM2_1_1]|nr:hypothetical protein [Oscillatoriales cyanobacterium SM2_3_0]NJO44900.1 hypothetical protein [Oscillatoriales cyanobacterium RM2_1_1]
MDSCRNLQQVHFTLKTVEVEKQKLQKSLAHSVEAQRELQSWGNHLNQEIDNLTDKITATNQLIKQFEGAYEEANTSTGLLSIGRRFILIMKAAQRLLNTDIQELIQKPSLPSEDPGEEWTKEDPANTNRRLLDK